MPDTTDSTTRDLLTWESKGEYITFEKKYKLFVNQHGNKNASSDRTLLLLHGFPESSISYKKVIPILLNTFDRVICFDFIGYGNSDKPLDYSYSLIDQANVALEVWYHFNIKGGHLVAHDMGNSVATELLARSEEGKLPAWFSKGLLSITLTNGSIVLKLSKLRIIQKLLLKSYGRLISNLTTYTIFKHQVKSAHGNNNLTPDDISLMWNENLKQNGHKKSYLTIRYINDRIRFEKKRWIPAVKSTDIPIHLCWGDQDQVARIEMAHYLKNKICPTAKLTIMKGLGHFCQIASPKTWSENVLNFECYPDKIKKEP